ncbi:MAG TPA: hypothetical protein VFO10_09155 [Oligoflexus sp.]|uniref:hypothetical protein n=1 Tax=Oligoflexus sp. TaxID=1971216 RepID=UPI002D803AD8|nr:hypothetical protein [Oligoflexus sp.]HET9237406.1 hypothetical protein [Oligoflexus sp.]
MMRILAFGPLLTFFMACSTMSGGSGPDGERLEMTGLEEMSLEYIKTKWGEPETNIPKGEGRVVHYKNIRSQDEDPVTGKVTVKSCEVRLDLTKELLVKTWEYENCKVVTSGK